MFRNNQINHPVNWKQRKTLKKSNNKFMQNNKIHKFIQNDEIQNWLKIIENLK